MKSDLKEILEYQHPAVVRRFKKEYPNRAEEAETIFSDLLRFFWASKKHELDRGKEASLDFVFIMDEDMKAIDQMWHVFLLYTQDYMDFCERYFGEYLHHLPDIVPTLNPASFDPEENLARFLDYNYELLGEPVIRRWFSETLQATAIA